MITSRNRDFSDHFRDRAWGSPAGLRVTHADWSQGLANGWAPKSTVHALQKLRGREYLPKLYQERLAGMGDRALAVYEFPDAFLEQVDPGPDDTVLHWLAHGRESALIVAGAAGMGKTSLFCRLVDRWLVPAHDVCAGYGCKAERLAEQSRVAPQDCLLLLPGDGWRPGATLFDRVREALDLRKDPPKGEFSGFEEWLTAWRMERQQSALGVDHPRLLLFVDGLNEALEVNQRLEEFAALAEAVRAANRRAARTWVRLLVAMRIDDADMLFEREQQGRDARVGRAVRQCATFRDVEGKTIPYLALRRFTSSEAASAYARVQAGSGPHCAVPWESLSPSTRELLRHPGMARLFHQAFAGIEPALEVFTADVLWDAWLTRGLDRMQGATGVERDVLDLADACIEAGHDRIPFESAHGRRPRCQQENGGDPLRGEADISWREQLIEIGVLRRLEGGWLDWGSDGLAEHLLCRALHRRDPNLTEASFTRWLARPANRRLDHALIRIAAAIWHSGRPLAVKPILDVPCERGKALAAGLLLAVVPRATVEDGDEALPAFAMKLRVLADACVSDPEPQRAGRLKAALLRELRFRPAHRSGHPSARVAMAQAALALAEHLSVLEPRNSQRQREVAIACGSLGELVGARDRAKGQRWYEKGLAIRKRLAEADPDNLEFQIELARAYYQLGELHDFEDWDQARKAYEQAFAIFRRLLDEVPDNSACRRGMSLTCVSLAFAAARSHPDVERIWLEELLALQRHWADQDPGDVSLQRKLVVVLERIGKVTRKRDRSRAKASYDQALPVRRRVAESECSCLADLRDLAGLLETLGRLEKDADPDQARDYYLEAVTIRRGLGTRWPDNLEYQRALARVCEEIGDLDRHIGRSDSRRWYEEVLAIRQKLAKGAPENQRLQQDLFESYKRFGDLCRPDQPGEARIWYEKMLEITLRSLELEPGEQSHRYHLWICGNRFCGLEGVGETVSGIRERLLALSSPRDPDIVVDAATRRFLSDPGWIHVMGELEPPCVGIQEALAWLERRHYPPRTGRSELLQQHVLAWVGTAWVIVSVPMVESSLIEQAAEQFGLRLMPGVPVKPASRGLYRPPFAGATLFTFVQGPDHPSFRLPPRAYSALVSQERETVRQIVKAADRKKQS